MKRKILLGLGALAIIGVSAGIGYSMGKTHVIDNAIIYNENHKQGKYAMEIDNKKYEYWYENSTDTMSLESITSKMTQEWQEIVIIKDKYVIYTGSPKDIDNSLKGLDVTDISNCEDTFAITLFVR